MWAAVAISALVVVAGLVMALGSAVVARHRAESAADLAALSAAAHALAGEAHACGRARWVAERMRVDLAACALAGWEVTVAVTGRPLVTVAGLGVARATARAGPVVDGPAVGVAR
ncbi:Rv3654c family TadE-like protein [Actinokineospora iranica]|uniref:Helicase/secretion neighborhood TadE-like protein n=1 Tax=Actinokineospora iranica TaxID=1271860 RepID=A0A1G6XVX3_9PSEU|nr:helicase/secretion neighborhood TadE-like protein [Actinokineospora iranica]